MTRSLSLALAGTVMFALPMNAGAQVFTNPAAIAIPDSGAATPYPSTITVAGAPTTGQQVTFSVEGLSHTFLDDIHILVVGPTGAASWLMADAGGGAPGVAAPGNSYAFTQNAATAIPDATIPPSGTYLVANYGAGDTMPAPAPAGTFNADLSVFNNTNPNGVWSLYVLDDAAGDLGTIAGGWTLTVQPVPEPTSMLLAGIGAVGFGWKKWRRRKA